MSDDIAKISDQIFPFMKLPYELRHQIYRFAAIKPDGYIGEVDDCGMERAVGAQQAQIKSMILD